MSVDGFTPQAHPHIWVLVEVSCRDLAPVYETPPTCKQDIATWIPTLPIPDRPEAAMMIPRSEAVATTSRQDAFPGATSHGACVLKTKSTWEVPWASKQLVRGEPAYGFWQKLRIVSLAWHTRTATNWPKPQSPFHPQHLADAKKIFSGLSLKPSTQKPSNTSLTSPRQPRISPNRTARQSSGLLDRPNIPSAPSNLQQDAEVLGAARPRVMGRQETRCWPSGNPTAAMGYADQASAITGRVLQRDEESFHQLVFLASNGKI